MKKILVLSILILLFGGFGFAQDFCTDGKEYIEYINGVGKAQDREITKCCLGEIYTRKSIDLNGSEDDIKCCESPSKVYIKTRQKDGDKIYDCCDGTPIDAPGTGLDSSCIPLEEGDDTSTPSLSAKDVGIDCDQEKLLNGQCKFNIYDTLGIRKSVRETGEATSVETFVQDVVLAATTFIGTVVVVALVMSGLLFVFAGANTNLKAKALKGIKYAIIGLLLVASSYSIIRLVQFIARGY